MYSELLLLLYCYNLNLMTFCFTCWPYATFQLNCAFEIIKTTDRIRHIAQGKISQNEMIN